MPASMRLGISALNRKDKANAVAEELIVDKQTGQMLIRTPEGNVVSYDSINRLSTHVRQIEDRVTDSGYMGSIGVIELDSEYPMILPAQNTVKLIESASPLVLFANKARQFLLSVDLDILKLSTNSSELISTRDFVTIGFRLTDGGTLDKYVELMLDSSKLNSIFFNPQDYLPKVQEGPDRITYRGADMANVKVTLETLSVNKSIAFTNATQYMYVLNGIVLFTEL